MPQAPANNTRAKNPNFRTVAQEDFPVSEGIQSGLTSGAQTYLTYGRNEPALAHFQDAVKRALGDIPE